MLAGNEWLLFYTEPPVDTGNRETALEATDAAENGEHVDNAEEEIEGGDGGGQENPAYQYEVFGSTFTDFVGPNAKPNGDMIEDARPPEEISQAQYVRI